MRLNGTLLAALTLTACGAPPRPPPRVAVLPIEAVGAAAPEAPQLRQELLAAIVARTAAVPVPAAAVDAAVDAAGPPPGVPTSAPRRCVRDPVCARAVGGRTGADQVLGLAVASLARTHVVSAHLWRVDQDVPEREVNETVLGEAPALAAAVRELAPRLFPPSRWRWYRSGWVWAGAAALVAAATTAAIVLTRSDASGGDVSAPLP